MIPTRRAVLRSIGAGTAVLAVGSGTAAGQDDEEDDVARVRVAHASPDAPNVDVFVDDAKVLADVPYTTVSGYLELPADTYEVTIAAASDAEEPDDADTVVFQDDVELDDGYYTVAAIGELNTEVTDEEFDVAIYEEDLDELDADTGRVRVVHASPDAPAVDVRVVDDDGNTVVTLAEDIEYGEAGENVEAEAGTYSVAVFPAGADEDLDAAVLGPADVEVRDGEVLTAFAMGFVDADPELELVLASEDAEVEDDEDDEDADEDADDEDSDYEDDEDDDDDDDTDDDNDH